MDTPKKAPKKTRAIPKPSIIQKWFRQNFSSLNDYLEDFAGPSPKLDGRPEFYACLTPVELAAIASRLMKPTEPPQKAIVQALHLTMLATDVLAAQQAFTEPYRETWVHPELRGDSPEKVSYAYFTSCLMKLKHHPLPGTNRGPKSPQPKRLREFIEKLKASKADVPLPGETPEAVLREWKKNGVAEWRALRELWQEIM